MIDHITQSSANTFKSLIHQYFRFIIIGLLIIVSLFCYSYYLSRHPSTSNASLQTSVTVITNHSPGLVQKVFVTENQHVKKGELLFTLDPKQAFAVLQTAQKALERVDPNFKKMQSNVNSALNKARAEGPNVQAAASALQKLRNNTSTKKADLNKAEKEYAAALKKFQSLEKAVQSKLKTMEKSINKDPKLKEAVANLLKAKIAVDQTNIYSPVKGVLNNFNLKVGQTIQAKQKLFNIIQSDKWMVSANFNEEDLRYIRTGQSAEFSLLMYPGEEFEGIVTGIGFGSKETNIESPHRFFKLPLKTSKSVFPVYILVTSPVDHDALPFIVGASADVTVDTKS